MNEGRNVIILLVCAAAVLADGILVNGSAASREEHLQLEGSDAAAEIASAADEAVVWDHGLPIITSGGDKPAAVSTHRVSRQSANMFQIFVLCVCMYGGIALMWGLFWRLPEENAGKAHGRVFLLCMTWASMSVGMQVLNKTLVSKLQAPALISVGQMWIAVLLVGIPSYKELLDAPRRQLMIWLIVPLFFAAMLCTSCYTYQYMSLSFYTVIRNMTPLIVLPVERALMPPDKCPKLSYIVLISMLVMLAGTLMYGGGIGNVSVIGVIFALTNMMLAVSDRLIQRRLLTTECTGLASSVCTVMNNAFGSVPALLLAGATHQISDMASPENRASWTDPRVLTLLVLSGAIGIGICYLGFECQRAISATSFFVLQNFSKVVVVVCGVFFFGDPISSPLAVAGLVLSIGGSFSYGKAQMTLQQEAAMQRKLSQRKLPSQPLAEKTAV
jgi:drug/metabolite transporter (DMT)-like permease